METKLKQEIHKCYLSMLAFLEPFAGLFKGMWIGGAAAALYFLIMDPGFWVSLKIGSKFFWAVGISIVGHFFADGFKENKLHRAGLYPHFPGLAEKPLLDQYYILHGIHHSDTSPARSCSPSGQSGPNGDMTSRTDNTTTIADLKEMVRAFRDERDWLQFHNPKDLAAAISIEAAELQEIFLWKGPDDVSDVMAQPRVREGVIDELADIMNFCLSLADVLDIDISTAVEAKLAKNADKYPTAKVRGKADKYDTY